MGLFGRHQDSKTCDNDTQAPRLRARDWMAEAVTAMKLEKSWPGESPYKVELELLREGDCMRLKGTMIRQAMMTMCGRG